jgi:hypothetical protein
VGISDPKLLAAVVLLPILLNRLIFKAEADSATILILPAIDSKVNKNFPW